VATYTTSGLISGTHTITATYSGDGNFNASTSPPHTQTVNQSPIVTIQPTDLTVNNNQTATFTAAASGYPAPTVQWQRSTDGGTTWNNLPGATSTTYSFTAHSGDNNHQFRAVFTNVAGSATTNAAILTVN